MLVVLARRLPSTETTVKSLQDVLTRAMLDAQGQHTVEIVVVDREACFKFFSAAQLESCQIWAMLEEIKKIPMVAHATRQSVPEQPTGHRVGKLSLYEELEHRILRGV